MKPKIRLLVFTDLDGTLIDHKTYDWSPAKPALDMIKSIGGGVVLASSKTAAEIIEIRSEMSLTDWPAIVENGAGRLAPNSDSTPASETYDRLRTSLNQIDPKLRRLFVGFGDMSVAQVVSATGLSSSQATLAMERGFSEPGTWTGTEKQRDQFQAALADQGITGRAGGRFLTLSFGTKKSDQMDAIINFYHPSSTIALGDAPNDIEMLNHADFGVIVSNPDGNNLPRLQGEDDGHIIRTTAAGPTGWSTAVLDHIEHLKRTGN